MINKKALKVRKRNDKFVDKASTDIWQEMPAADNPYVAEKVLCHGYDLLELSQKRSYVDVIYLLFKGELPNKEQHDLLEKFMIALCNPGPRHNATRAAIHAGVGKTEATHILPISLSILSGQHLGASEVQKAMRFLRDSNSNDVNDVVSKTLKNMNTKNKGDTRIAPGFGSHYGGIDLMAEKIAKLLNDEKNTKNIDWGIQFAKALKRHDAGWLMPGIAAAVFLDLGFNSRYGSALFQLISAPGLLAHGLEVSEKPTTAIPFLSQENYIMED